MIIYEDDNLLIESDLDIECPPEAIQHGYLLIQMNNTPVCPHKNIKTSLFNE